MPTPDAPPRCLPTSIRAIEARHAHRPNVLAPAPFALVQGGGGILQLAGKARVGNVELPCCG
jgi:hypothetical protein